MGFLRPLAGVVRPLASFAPPHDLHVSMVRLRSPARYPPDHAHNGLGLASRDSGDEANLFDSFEPRFHAVVLADVDAVHVDVHQLPKPAALVEDEVGDREGAERRADRVCFDLEAALPADLCGEHPRKEDYRQSAASTERMGGRCVAASTQVSPRSALAKTEPLCVPK